MGTQYVLQETAVREPFRFYSLHPFHLSHSISDHHQPLLNIFSPPGSQHGWCDTDFAHCDPADCLKAFSGPGSSCASDTSVSKTTLKTTSSTNHSSTSAYISSIPNIDVCGSASGGVSCPGAGTNVYFYRCCSSHGHCGPKNDVLLALSPIRPKKSSALLTPHPPPSSKTNPSTAAPPPAANRASATAPPTAPLPPCPPPRPKPHRWQKPADRS